MPDDYDVHRLEVQGYTLAMYRDPNSGDMRFDITTPANVAVEDIAIDVNDERVYPA